MRPLLTLILPPKPPNLLPNPPSRVLPLLLTMLPIGILPMPQLDRTAHPAVVRVPGELVARGVVEAVLAAVPKGGVGRVVGVWFVEGREVGIVPVLVVGGWVVGREAGGCVVWWGEDEGEKVAVC